MEAEFNKMLNQIWQLYFCIFLQMHETLSNVKILISSTANLTYS